MKRTRVKICGLTRPEDVMTAGQAGADALGFVFAPQSRRRLDLHQARALIATAPAFVTCVGLFQDQGLDEVRRVIDELPLAMLQFHGSETPEFCRSFGLPYIKAVSMHERDAHARAEDAFGDAVGLLLDSHRPGGAGGTGATFDWSLIGTARMPVILAGGLNAENVCEAVRNFRPWAVDVSSGVESQPGIKDPSKIAAFVNEVERGNRTQD